MQGNPIFLHMLGIPGAGKTTFLDTLMSRWNKGPSPFLLGFDQVMQAMPGYQVMEDKVAAFAKYELPAREEGYRLLQYLMAEQKPILFDNGGSAASHVDILRSAQQQGYRVVLVSIVTPVAVAKARVDVRAISEGRHTPMTYLEERATKLAVLEREYRALTPFFYEIENSGNDFQAFQKSCHDVAGMILQELSEAKAV